jgi:hypothetical protein
MSGYHLLERVLEEQCTLRESEGDESPSVTVKNPEEIPSDSLQNPSDPDATYSGHKGQGYQVQVMETYCTDKDAKAETLNLITHVQVDPAHESDVKALIPALKSTQERGLGPKETLADSLYGSDDNCQAAKQLGVKLFAPTMGRPRQQEDTLTPSEFIVSPHRRYSCLSSRLCPGAHKNTEDSPYCRV